MHEEIIAFRLDYLIRTSNQPDQFWHSNSLLLSFFLFVHFFINLVNTRRTRGVIPINVREEREEFHAKSAYLARQSRLHLDRAPPRRPWNSELTRPGGACCYLRAPILSQLGLESEHHVGS